MVAELGARSRFRRPMTPAGGVPSRPPNGSLYSGMGSLTPARAGPPKGPPNGIELPGSETAPEPELSQTVEKAARRPKVRDSGGGHAGDAGVVDSLGGKVGGSPGKIGGCQAIAPARLAGMSDQKAAEGSDRVGGLETGGNGGQLGWAQAVRIVRRVAAGAGTNQSSGTVVGASGTNQSSVPSGRAGLSVRGATWDGR